MTQLKVGHFKKSIRTLKHTWGTAMMGNFSLGLLGFLLMLPVILLVIFLVYLASMTGSTALVVLAVGLGES